VPASVAAETSRGVGTSLDAAVPGEAEHAATSEGKGQEQRNAREVHVISREQPSCHGEACARRGVGGARSVAAT
jgi:hypothetical protein